MYSVNNSQVLMLLKKFKTEFFGQRGLKDSNNCNASAVQIMG